MIIYKITNIINGKMYVGQTIHSLEKRFKDHCKKSKCRGIHSAIIKYGPSNFKVEVIETVDCLEKLNDREVFWIKELNTISPNGYNLCSGGNNGRIIAEETRNLLASKVLGKFGDSHPAYGSKRTLEQRIYMGKKIKESYVGREFNHVPSDKVRELARLARIGSKHSDQTKAKMSEKRKGRAVYSKKIIATDLLNKTTEFSSIKEAAEVLGINRRSISNVLNGWSKSSNNYKFEYIKGNK